MLRLIRLLILMGGGTMLLMGTLAGQAPIFRQVDLPVGFRPQHLVQDDYGMVWAAGNKKLYQFDGLQWTLFKEWEAPISCLNTGKGPTLWIGLEDGQLISCLLKGGISSSVPAAVEAPIKQVLETSQGIWIATAGEGLWFLPQGSTVWKQVQGLPDPYFYALLSLPDGAMWAASDRGIVVIDPERLTLRHHLDRKNGLPDEIVRSLLYTGSHIWAGTYEGGISTIDPETSEINNLPNWPGGVITCLEASPEGLLIGTERKGLWQWDSENGFIQLNPGLRSRVEVLLLDQERNLWTSSSTMGLQIGMAAFQYYPLDGQEIVALSHGKELLWLATETSCFAFRPPNFLQALPIPVRGKLSCVYEDQTGCLWIGTQGEGVWRFWPEPERWEHYTETDGLLSDHILSISGNDSLIWFATFGGAASLPVRDAPGLGQMGVWNQSDGLDVNYIYQALPDQLGRVWFGTDGKGLRYLAADKIHTVSEIASETVLNLATAPDSSIWVHIEEQGFFHYAEGHLQGTPWPSPGSISDFTIDPYGRILSLSPEGIALYLPKTGESWDFTAAQGYPMADVGLNLLSQDHDGNVWIGTQQGILCFRPAWLRSMRRPRVILQELSVFMDPINVQADHRFAYDQNHLSFTYTGLWYQAPEEVSFRYRLEGLDLDWIQSDNRQLIYPRLAPGNYTLELQANNNPRFETASIQRFSFMIQRPFWQKWWFVLGGMTVFFLLLYSWQKYRENRIKRTQRLESAYLSARFETLKNQINPHFLFNSFNTLAAIIDQDSQKAITYVEHLSDLFRNILEFRKVPLITLEQELALLDKFYFLQQQRFGDNFRLFLSVPTEQKALSVPPLTLQMLVENALKHNIISKKRPLSIWIEVQKPGYLSIRNTLQLRRDPSASTQLGQENIQERYQLLSEMPVQIEISESYYTVHIPLLSA